MDVGADENDLNTENFVDPKSNQVQEDHPNTYTLTKHFAEHIVNDYYGKLPICIVRPSIVTPSLLEPYPGWIDNLACFTGKYCDQKI